MNRHLLGSQISLLLTLAFTSGTVLLQAQQPSSTTTMYVRCKGTASVPAYSVKQEQIATLRCGQLITVVKENDGWVTVELPNGRYALVSSYALGKEAEQVSSCPEGMTRVQTETGSTCRYNSAENARSSNPQVSAQPQQAEQPITDANGTKCLYVLTPVNGTPGGERCLTKESTEQLVDMVKSAVDPTCLKVPSKEDCLTFKEAAAEYDRLLQAYRELRAWSVDADSRLNLCRAYVTAQLGQQQQWQVRPLPPPRAPVNCSTVDLGGIYSTTCQ